MVKTPILKCVTNLFVIVPSCSWIPLIKTSTKNASKQNHWQVKIWILDEVPWGANWILIYLPKYPANVRWERNCFLFTVRYIDTRYHMKNVWYQILIPWMTPNKMLGYTKSWFSCMVNTIRYHTTSRDFQTLYFFWTRSKVRCSCFGGFLKWGMPQCNHPPPKARGRQMDQ